jgi:hypothetical protein
VYLGAGDAHCGPDSHLYAFDPTGQLKWRYDTRALRVGSPAIGADGVIYTPASPTLFALRADGTLLWSKGPTGNPPQGEVSGIITPGIGPDGTIYLGNSQGFITALDPATQAIRWSYRTGPDPTQTSFYGIPSFPVVDNQGTVYMGSVDGKMYAMTRTGQVKWSYPTGGHITEAAPALGPDGTLYFGSEDGYLYALAGPANQVTATPTPSASPVPTLSPSVTPTASPAATFTRSATLTATASLAATPTRGATATLSTLPTASPTVCPAATPELLAVDPVISPTDRLTQTITVRIGNGEAVTVTAESGTFTTAGTFNSSSNPAMVEMQLLPDTTHHLSVSARVRVVASRGCTYGGYTLNTDRDRLGAPLTIVQQSSGGTSTPTPGTSTPVPSGSPTATASATAVVTPSGLGGRGFGISAARAVIGAFCFIPPCPMASGVTWSLVPPIYWNARLSWSAGAGQTGYLLVRLQPGSSPTGAPTAIRLPAAATTYDDAVPGTGLVCYVLAILRPDGRADLSDLLCTLAGTRGGAQAPPQDFTLRLNQSTTASFTWTPTAGATGYALVSTAGDLVPLRTDAVSTSVLIRGFTCFTLAAITSVSVSYPDFVCGLPGVSTLSPGARSS